MAVQIALKKEPIPPAAIEICACNEK
jgi:hypothetical protein